MLFNCCEDICTDRQRRFTPNVKNITATNPLLPPKQNHIENSANAAQPLQSEWSESVITAEKALKLLSAPTCYDDAFLQSLHTKTASLENSQDLLAHGYSLTEINNLCQAGMTPLVLGKLIQKDRAPFSELESVACIKSCVEMGLIEAEKASSHSLVLVIGDSGTGKSTAVNYLAGCTMREVSIPMGVGSRTKKHVIVDPQSQIPEIMPIGHNRTCSKTLIPVVGVSQSGIVFCDCPGFQDSRGPEINISNAVNIRNIIQAAKFAKVLVLIPYATIRIDAPARSKAALDLKKTIDDLFGSDNSMKTHQASLLIGLTRVPVIDGDGEPLSAEDVLDEMYSGGIFPAELRSSTLILEPMGKRDAENFSRQVWLDRIVQLQPVVQHKDVFKTVLNAEDETLLFKLSKMLGEQLQNALRQNQIQEAYHYLQSLQYLSIIQREQVTELFQKNLNQIKQYVQEKLSNIRELSHNLDFQAADVQLLKMSEWIKLFKNIDPSLHNLFMEAVEYNNEQRLGKVVANFDKARQTFFACYYGNHEKKKLAYPIHRELNLSKNNIHADDALAYLDNFLKKLAEFKEFAFAIKGIEFWLSDVKALSQALHNEKAYQEQCTKLISELRYLADAVHKQHEENSLELLAGIKFVIFERMKNAKELMAWDKHGQEVFSKLDQLTSENVLQVLTDLSQLDYLKESMSDIYQQLITAQKIKQTLSCKHELLTLPDLVYKELMKIKSDLATAKAQEEIRLKKEQEEKRLQEFIKAIMAMINSASFEDLENLNKTLSTFNEEQLERLKADDRIDSVLKEKLHETMQFLESILTWEKHGKVFLKIEAQNKGNDINISRLLTSLIKVEPVTNVNSYCLLLDQLYTVANSVLKLPVANIKGYESLILRGINKFFKDFAKHQAEEERRQREELLKQEAKKIVERINKDLIPADDAEGIKQRLEQLEKTAPDFLPLIALSTYINSQVELFNERLLKDKNYRAAKIKLTLLEKLQSILGTYFVKLGVRLDIAVLSSSICSQAAIFAGSATNEVNVTFDKAAIESVNVLLQPMLATGTFFELTSIFSSYVSVNQELVTLRNNILAKLRTLFKIYQNVDGRDDARIFVKLLLQSQLLSKVTGSRNVELTQAITNIRSEFIRKRAQDLDFLAQVENRLTAISLNGTADSQYAKEIIAQYSEFKGAANSAWLNKTKDRCSQNIITELRDVQQTQLTTAHSRYEEIYFPIHEAIHEQYGKEADGEVLKKAVQRARALGQQLYHVSQYYQYPQLVAEMLANIFGVWSYLDAHRGGFRPHATELRLPHSSQIVAILLLFGLGRSQALQNQLIEVKTGEGKSVISAGAAIAFSLVGFQVHVGCYTPYLAERDQLIFAELYEQFGLKNQIVYGDFSQIFELFIQDIGDIRSLVLSFAKKQPPNCITSTASKKLFFVDEVDVLFSPKFLGKTYNPAVELTSDAFKRLILNIWDNRTSFSKQSKSDFIKNVRENSFMREFLQTYPGVEALADLIITQIYDGFIGIFQNNHFYSCYKGQIAYLDEVANIMQTTTSYGCYTPFAAAKEYRLGNIEETELDRRVMFLLRAGRLSYAEMPKNYTHVIGVTGTLFPLSRFEDKVLRDHNIYLKSPIPTVFSHKHVLPSESPVKVCAGALGADDKLGYFNNIRLKVEEYVRTDRAVLIIFHDEKRLKSYDEKYSAHYQTQGTRTNILTSSTSTRERDVMISEAAGRNTVTLMTSAYGRGSDFICHEDAVRNRGGVAVICTFFPETETEEIQYKGRTCRQQDPGSFEMILHLDDLKDLGVNHMSQLENTNLSQYRRLSQLRTEKLEERGNQMENDIQKAKVVHEKTIQLVRILRNSRQGFFSLGKQTEEVVSALKLINAND